MKKSPLKIFFIFYFLVFTSKILSAQTDSSIHAKISLITCAPGGELYATFGHTALRIVDSNQHSDLIFNYGTFDFDDPNFYTKFVRGKLDYFLSFDPLPNFLYGYQLENRSVWEQELNLNNHEKKKIIQTIQDNLIGSNRYYKYDFLYDNCTSRVKDILIKEAGLAVNRPLVKEGTTFRMMLHEYLDAGHLPWSKLGIDILLGSPADKKVTLDESLFLPGYLMKAVDSSIYNNKNLLKQKSVLFTAQNIELSDNKYQPTIVFIIVWFLILSMYISKNHFIQKLIPVMHSLLLYATGFIGILLLFMWFGSDHKAFGWNYNLLWALPTNIVAAFFVWKNPKWLKNYFIVTGTLYGLLLLGWFSLPQQLNIALIAVAVMLLTMSIRIVSSRT